MGSGIAVRPREALKEPLPALAVGPGRTHHSALDGTFFKGRLRFWAEFENEVGQRFSQTEWEQLTRTIKHRPKAGPALGNVANEYFRCGAEEGVRGRFQQGVAQTMSAIFAAASKDLCFGDYQAAANSIHGAGEPDFAIMSTISGNLRAIGEVKTPWVGAHSLENAFSLNRRLRGVLGMSQSMARELYTDEICFPAQPARYMRENQVKYGFITTFDETIFLKQVEIAGRWTLLYSKPIKRGRTITGDEGDAIPGATALACFWFLGLEMVENGHQAQNNLHMDDWVA